MNSFKTFSKIWRKLSVRPNPHLHLQIHKQIPERKGYPIFGTAFEIKRKGLESKLHIHIDQGHKLLGPIFKENLGSLSAIFISDPNMMRFVFMNEGSYPRHFLPEAWTVFNKMFSCKRGLFFMDGEEWQHHRGLMNPHFFRRDVTEDLKPVHEAVVSHLIKRWKNYDGKVVPNLEHEFYRHSISFLIGSLLGSSYIKNIDSFEDDIDKMAHIFHNIFATTAVLNGMPVKLFAMLSLPSWKRFKQAVTSSLEACHEVVDKMINMRSPDGLLDGLMQDISVDVVKAIVVDLILAAGDTTAVTSQWSLYLLSGNKEVQKSMIEGTCDVKHVVKEVLRLYPPAIFISRYIPIAKTYDDYTLPADKLIFLSMYTAGRSSDNYVSPNEFIPNRWIRSPSGRELQGVLQPMAYMPFASRLRSCIGKHLALSQLHYTISEIVSKFELDLEEDVDMILRLVPVPSKPLKIHIKSRE